MACRLVWRQVEMDVANARFVEDVEASFERNCMDLQKSQIFYKACEDMYDDLWAMTDDYMSSEYSTDKMCVRAKVCRPIPFKLELVPDTPKKGHSSSAPHEGASHPGGMETSDESEVESEHGSTHGASSHH